LKHRNLHRWDVNPSEAVSIQKELRNKLILKFPKIEIKKVAGVDLAFKGDYSFAIVVILSFPNFEVLEVKVSKEEISYPYIPGLLSFREGPAFLKAWEKVRIEPDVVFFDGQGIAHPRGFGLAAHMGLFIEKPTIGVAKSRLFGYYKNPPQESGTFSYLLTKTDKKIGAVVRTVANQNPVFVSPGHLMDINNAIKLTLKCVRKNRIPEPTRLAHIYTQKAKKGELKDFEKGDQLPLI